MTQVAERQSALTVAFERFRTEAAFAAGGLGQTRETAFARFSASGFPTTRLEEWKHTNVAPIAQTPFVRPEAADVSREAAEPFLFSADLPHRVVLVNGRWSPSLSSVAELPAGVTVRSLREALANPTTALGGRIADAPAQMPFVDLNTALFEDGVVIEVAPKAVIDDPLHIVCLTVPGAQPAMICPRIIVVAGERSEISLVESYGGIADGVTLTNAVTQVDVGVQANVDHVKFQREQRSTFHMAATFARVDRGGRFTSHAVTLGGKIARNDIISTLAGEGAECTLDGLYVADGDSLVDTHTTIDHAMPHQPSHELYKGILSGRARAVFNGKIIVRQDAQKTNAKQTNKALLLSDDAQINTKPQLEIFADDVKCTHGAAIGQLDEDALFYLQARGLTFFEARDMLIHAFAGDILDRVQIKPLKQALESELYAQLARDLAEMDAV